MDILNNTYKAEKDDNGHWIYKANLEKIFTNKKILKKKYHELPRYKIVVEYENKFKEQYNTNTTTMVKELVKQLKDFI